jgi:hypothetical protein
MDYSRYLHLDYRSGLSFSLLAIFLFVIVCYVFYPWNLQTTSGYGSDAEITALVDQYDWKFIPIANPDGYAYTWSNVNGTGPISWPICIIIRRAIQNVIHLFFKISISKDRLWRKNRVFNNGSTCLGVDVNRNFPVGFGGSSGSSDLACSTSKTKHIHFNLNFFLICFIYKHRIYHQLIVENRRFRNWSQERSG